MPGKGRDALHHIALTQAIAQHVNHYARLYSLRFFISRPRRTRIALTSWPEGQSKPNEKHGAQQQEECELLEPSDRRYRDSHGDTQKADLKRRKINTESLKS